MIIVTRCDVGLSSGRRLVLELQSIGHITH